MRGARALRSAVMPEITTPSGRLAGVTIDFEGRAVHAFRGVPYATAARFAPPVLVTSWAQTQHATVYGPAAPQPVGGPLDGLVPGSFRGATDEHACLTLNVFVSARATADKRPVLVWFPGGAFTT